MRYLLLILMCLVACGPTSDAFCDEEVWERADALNRKGKAPEGLCNVCDDACEGEWGWYNGERQDEGKREVGSSYQCDVVWVPRDARAESSRASIEREVCVEVGK